MAEQDDDRKEREQDAQLLAHTLAMRALLRHAFGDERPDYGATIIQGITNALADEGVTERGQFVLQRAIEHVDDLFGVGLRAVPRDER